MFSRRALASTLRHQTRRRQAHRRFCASNTSSPQEASGSQEKPAVSDENIPAPSGNQLRAHFIASAVPMVGFGFMDNMVMIQAGDFIDNTIGVQFGLKTLTAAACGQIVSDVSGVLFGGVIDRIANAMGLPQSYLTTKQLALPQVKRTGVAGAVIGVMLGCTLGMSSLFFMDLDAADRERRMKKLDTLFKTVREVMQHGNELIGAQHCTFWLVDKETETCVTKMHGGQLPKDDRLRVAFDNWDHDHNGSLSAEEIQIGFANIGREVTLEDCRKLMEKLGSEGKRADGSLLFEGFKQMLRDHILTETVVLPLQSRGIKGCVYHSGHYLNLMDVRRDRRFASRMAGWDKYIGYQTQSMLVIPVKNEDGEVLGLIEMVNKFSRRGKSIAEFDEDDIKLVEMLAHHCAIFIEEATDG